MPNTKYSRGYLKNHFFYCRWIYLAVVVATIALAELGYTMTRYQAPNARRVDIELIGGYADVSDTEATTAALLAAGQAYELARDAAAGIDTQASDYEVPLQEVEILNIDYTGEVSDEDDYYAGQKYMVMLAAQEGDIYVVTRSMLESLVEQGGIIPLDEYIESGLLPSEGMDLEDVTFDEPVLEEGDTPSGERYIYALPAAQLTGMVSPFTYNVSDKYLVIMAYSQNQDTAAAVMAELFNLFGEEVAE